MLQIHRPLGSELTLRLVHDISPESATSSDEDDVETTAINREQFILSCLNQSTNLNNNSISDVSQTRCDKYCVSSTAESITATYAKLELKQSHLEQINNHINEQHLNKVLENHQINLLNNNLLQTPAYDESDSSDKENTQPVYSYPAPRSHGTKGARRPRKLPDIPKKNTAPLLPLKCKLNNEKCLADELQEALVKTDHSDSDNEDVFMPNTTKTLPKVYPKYSGKLIEDLKNRVKFNSVSKNTRAYLNSDNVYLQEDSSDKSDRGQDNTVSSNRGRKGSNDGEGPGKTISSVPATNYQDLEVTHRGMHRFITRHKDEMEIEIGDPIHVNKTGDDLWCEGVNLRTNKSGLFPSMYATDLAFLEEEEEDNGCSKFFLRFLGSVEVNYHKGDEVLCQAINKVALSRRAVKSSVPPPVCTLEISQYGIRMFDKSKTGHENLDTFTHFFALKHITFCGHHPRNERYFGFITKHPKEYRYACHVFLGEKSTRSVTDAMGQSFKKFYQEYMAFTHPTEDIYME